MLFVQIRYHFWDERDGRVAVYPQFFHSVNQSIAILCMVVLYSDYSSTDYYGEVMSFWGFAQVPPEAGTH